uniref:Uncharacterized protein n=1 Tax=Arundo donax TaxID=35708 RepID=A0A0A8ZJM1_ARUDO
MAWTAKGRWQPSPAKEAVATLTTMCRW